MKNLFILLISLLAVAAAFPAQGEGLAMPQSYADCKKGAPYTTVTELKCIFNIAENRHNGPETRDFLACHFTNPNYEYLKKFDCKYVPSDDLTKLSELECTRKRMPVQRPRLQHDCRSTFYNPGYEWPTTYDACMKREDRVEDVTTELKKTCTLTITYSPEIAGDFMFDDDEANALVEKCQLAGGRGQVIAGSFPACSLTLIEP
ncbi:MAG TPA: hypothetical protein VEF76_05800 [Patescibacteria group bacterium]|nr:hypothetical protein [Patescibacteria group bacterium]